MQYARALFDVGLEIYKAEKAETVERQTIRTDSSGATTDYLKIKAYTEVTFP